jgi:Domain of unknown function (DUF4145)
MKITVRELSGTSFANVAIRCPHCGHFGTFVAIGQDLFINEQNVTIGQRRCPNTSCMGHIFFIVSRKGEILKTYPSDTIPFDKTSIPEKILNAFTEAITCHSNNCFIASAIMIRKTLEEIANEEKITGKNLKERLKGLGNRITIPKELIDGMDDLRLLGNDAAHIEANTFEQIGKTEIEISLEFTKEILKATYQYENLLGKLRSLKKNAE